MSASEEFAKHALRTLAEAGRPQTPAAVETRLLDAFRREHRVRRMRRRIAASLMGVGAAATCVSIGLWLPKATRFDAPAVITRQHEPPPVAWVTSAVNAPGKKEIVRGVIARVRKPAHKPPSDRLAAAPFIALPYGDASLINDGATVVRVELPQSALRVAGFAVAQDRAGDRVQADLLVGVDGLPHAVRLIGLQE